ncbi:hypothetical protein ACOMHN_044979 [Nucella lapillus]
MAEEKQVIIYPEGGEKVYDLTTSRDSSLILFACQIPGMTAQEANLKWFNKANKEIVAKEGDVFIQYEGPNLNLRIFYPSKKDAGVYTCRGEVDDKELEASKALKIWDGIKVLSDKEQYIINGTDDRVLCEIVSSNDFDEPLVSWFKVITDAQSKSSWKPIFGGDKFVMFKPPKVSADNPAYLEIRNVSLADQDTYLCNVNVPKLGKSHAHFINVVVTVPPTFTRALSAQPMEPKEGERLELSCEAEGIPAPLYNFTKYTDASRKEGEVVLENSTVGYYVIEHVKRGDEGLYECVAMNQGGTENVSVEVNVRVFPAIEAPYNITEEEGRDIRLACVAIGDPAPQLLWRKTNSPAFTLDPTQKVYVEEEGSGEEGLDPVSRVFRRTLYLVIPMVEPAQAGQYSCQASSAVGMVQHTFHVNVNYKPIFGDKVDSHFYGWVGGDTNLTCMASGNPTPQITWYKDSAPLKKDDIYDIALGDSDVPHRNISYLIPRVDPTNQDLVFGSYRCEAKNDLGKNEVQLTYHLAVVPEQAEVTVVKDYPTAFKLKPLVPEQAEVTVVKDYPTAFKLELRRPEREGGQPVMHFIVSYVRADSDEDPQTVEVPLSADNLQTETELTGLTPNTEYDINITAVNNVGTGLSVNLSALTKDYSKPEKVEIISDRRGNDAKSYTLRWTIPMTGGAEISNYLLEYALAEKVNTSTEPWHAIKVSSDTFTLNLDGEDTVNALIDKLAKDTYYQVKIKAVNRIGPSEVSTFVFKTGLRGSIEKSSPGSRVQVSAAVLLLVTMAMTSLHALF